MVSGQDSAVHLHLHLRDKENAVEPSNENVLDLEDRCLKGAAKEAICMLNIKKKHEGEDSGSIVQTPILQP